MRFGLTILPEHRWSDAAPMWRRAQELGLVAEAQRFGVVHERRPCATVASMNLRKSAASSGCFRAKFTVACR